MGKEALFGLIVIVAVAAVVLGVVVWNPQGERRVGDTGVRAAKGTRPAASGSDRRLRNEVEALNDRVETLREDLLNVEDTLGVLRSEIAALRKEMKQPGAKTAEGGGGLPPMGGDFSPEKWTPEQRQRFQREVARSFMSWAMTKVQQVKSNFVKNIESQIDSKFAEQLDLTEAQKEDIKAIIKEQVDKGLKTAAELFQKGDFTSMQGTMRKLMDETDERIKGTLDPDQIEKWKEMDPQFKRREDRRAARKAKEGQGF